MLGILTDKPITPDDLSYSTLIGPNGGYQEPAPGYGHLLGHPSTLTASDFAAWFFLFWAGLLVVLFALPWAIRRLAQKDPLPSLMLLAGLGTSLGEPMLDLVGHLRWSENLLGPAFVNFGIPVPVLIPPCYMLFMGLESYWVYLMIQKGINMRGWMLMFAACGVSDAIMEHPGVLMNVYEYYGHQPFEFYKFPFYWSFTNGVAIVTISVLLHYVWPMVKGQGLKQLWVVPLGIIGTTAGEFGTGFPVFLAINASIPTWLQWVIGSGTLVLSVLWVRALGKLVTTNSTIKWTFWGLFKARFMTPARREAYIRSVGWNEEHTPPPAVWPPFRLNQPEPAPVASGDALV